MSTVTQMPNGQNHSNSYEDEEGSATVGHIVCVSVCVCVE